MVQSWRGRVLVPRWTGMGRTQVIFFAQLESFSCVCLRFSLSFTDFCSPNFSAFTARYVASERLSVRFVSRLLFLCRMYMYGQKCYSWKLLPRNCIFSSQFWLSHIDSCGRLQIGRVLHEGRYNFRFDSYWKSSDSHSTKLYIAEKRGQVRWVCTELWSSSSFKSCSFAEVSIPAIGSISSSRKIPVHTAALCQHLSKVETIKYRWWLVPPFF